MDLIQQARQRLAAIDAAVAELAAERADWKAFLDAADRLAPRLIASAVADFHPAVASWQHAPVQLNDTAQRRFFASSKPTKKDQVLAIAASALEGGRYMQAKELGNLVVAKGIDMGADPTGYVSVMLSRDPRFKSERAKGGWHIISGPNNEKAPQGVEAPAGPDLLDFQPASVTAGTGTTPD